MEAAGAITGGDGHATEDLVPDALVQMLERPPKVTTPGRLKAWLSTVMTRFWVDRFRREYGYEPMSLDWLEDWTGSDLS